MTFNPAPWVRKTIYIVNVLSIPLIAYLKAKNYIGDLEVNFFLGELAAVMTLAAVNVSK